MACILINSMIYRQNMIPKLLRVTTYKSPIGGSRDPADIQEGRLFRNRIREGSVYGFEDSPILHGEASVFCHYERELTRIGVSRQWILQLSCRGI